LGETLVPPDAIDPGQGRTEGERKLSGGSGRGSFYVIVLLPVAGPFTIMMMWSMGIAGVSAALGSWVTLAVIGLLLLPLAVYTVAPIIDALDNGHRGFVLLMTALGALPLVCLHALSLKFHYDKSTAGYYFGEDTEAVLALGLMPTLILAVWLLVSIRIPMRRALQIRDGDVPMLFSKENEDEPSHPGFPWQPAKHVRENRFSNSTILVFLSIGTVVVALISGSYYTKGFEYVYDNVSALL
jgi:hypothetical protein